ncbi:hypothetical protein [Cohnella rhizosphaerae]|uniref:Transcription regulator PadR N-terminal domain-containing protein n=1 Tax=Cohnella rhizosphaerae TaxID=1457232 RepID=A0A9X4QVW4_9BACL|nr:hypothetical protein [Cohnella rhizosphaerae]MDG0813175.1 hypothetical protein [Cohnella rhizosphaerae]
MGYIAKESVVQEARPNKNVYSLTAEGKTQFEHYLHSPVEKDSYRSDFLVRMFFGGVFGRRDARRLDSRRDPQGGGGRRSIAADEGGLGRRHAGIENVVPGYRHRVECFQIANAARDAQAIDGL